MPEQPADKESGWLAPVSRWAFLDTRSADGKTECVPDVSFIAPLMRRRLSLLSRMTLRVAQDCAHDRPTARMVFASRHGEINRTTALLDELAREEALSPTAFSTSVLNAGAGQFSILNANTAAATAISAADESFGYGLLEACAQLASHPESPVLFIYADESLPQLYQNADSSSHPAHALGLLLETGAAMQILCSRSTADLPASEEPQSLAFLRCVESGKSHWLQDGSCWKWTRQ